MSELSCHSQLCIKISTKKETTNFLFQNYITFYFRLKYKTIKEIMRNRMQELMLNQNMSQSIPSQDEE